MPILQTRRRNDPPFDMHFPSFIGYLWMATGVSRKTRAMHSDWLNDSVGQQYQESWDGLKYHTTYLAQSNPKLCLFFILRSFFFLLFYY